MASGVKSEVFEVKRGLLLSVWCALALVGAFTAFCLFTPAAARCDFNYRMAEVDCVRRGVDPFRVWNEEVVVRPYYSNNPERRSIPEGCSEMISVYEPWEYTLMMPFSFLGKEAAWLTYSFLSFAAILLLVLVAGYRAPLWAVGNRSDVFFGAGTGALVVCYPIWSNLQIGNHICMVLFFAVLMAHCLNARRDFLAGLCWMMIMMKPQIGLIFAVPILLRMKVKVGIVAVASCILLSIPSAILCQASLFDLLLEPAGASAFAFEGCGTWPKFLCGTFSQGGDILAGTIIGVAVCLWATWLLRREQDWFVILMPSAMLSSCWTYTQAYSHAMGWFLAFVLVRELVCKPRSKFLWTMLALAAFVLSRWFLAWHGLCSFVGWRFPMSEYAFRCVDSLNSTASLVLAAVFCVWKARNATEVSAAC